MNWLIKELKKNAYREGWNNNWKPMSRYPNSEYDAFYASESNELLCALTGVDHGVAAILYHDSIWLAHRLADRCFKYSEKYFNHPTGRSYFNPWYRRAHQAKHALFFERLMIRKLAKRLNTQGE